MSQNINVDLIPKFAVYGNLYFSQYDVGREAIINLVNGSTEYEIPSGATVTLVATKPSGLGFTQNCTFEGNQITVVCTAEMTDEAGHFPCEIRIANGSLLLGTANFTFNVERSPHPEGTTDGTADSVISQITVAFESAMTQIENSGGLTNDIKETLLNCFRHVTWIDEHGQDYYDALEEALYTVEVTGITLNSSSLLFNELNQTSQLIATLIPSTATNPISWSSSDTSVCTVVDGLVTSVGYGNATITATAGSVSATCSVSIVELTVVSLNAVLNGGTFYVGDPIDNIKPYLTVTANWSDSTSTTVPSGSYTLSGSLSNVGANTITVSYGGQSTTVTVNVVSVELVSISAVYTQSGTVYTSDTLDNLKSDLVVTATYSDSSTSTVASTDYTLSGTLTVGTSTITVAYSGMTTTFNVNVTADQTYVESTSTLSASTDWTYSAGKLNLADGTVDSSTTTWNTSEMIQIPSGTTSYALATNSTINNEYAIVWFDSEQTYIGSGISNTYSSSGSWGGGYTADGLCWNSVPVTALYCKISWKNTHTVTSVSFRHNIKLDENITPVYNKIYYYTYDSSTIATNIVNDDFLPCGGMAYAQIRPILQRSITFYDEDYIQVSQIVRATNIGNNVEVPSNAVYMKCQNTNRIASNANTTTLLGTGLIEFTETTLSEW